LRSTSQETSLTAWPRFDGHSRLSPNGASRIIISESLFLIAAKYSIRYHFSGELLLDQQRFGDAVEKFERAIELERLKYVLVHLHINLAIHHKYICLHYLRRTPPNVLPLVNKGLAIYQWKQDMGAAERCCNEALRIDPECEAAVATLAQFSLQQNKIERAIEMFARQVDLARSEPELANALTYQYVSLRHNFFVL
jgi:import receptor subunit TOM70